MIPVGVHGGASDWLKSAGNASDVLHRVAGSGNDASPGLTDSQVTDGLKEALQVGSEKAIEAVSQPDGYYGNPTVKIPLPESVQSAEQVLRATGFGSTVDAFELSMNRAAEKAAPEAKGLFLDAIQQMSISDAQKILNGRDNEATLYFKDKTSTQLESLFKPIIEDSMAQVGVTQSYQGLQRQMKTIPFAGGSAFDLDQYVTENAIDGLFKMLAEQEAMIRTDPAARTTDLLKAVFGN
jgi:hypothetical protein